MRNSTSYQWAAINFWSSIPLHLYSFPCCFPTQTQTFLIPQLYSSPPLPSPHSPQSPPQEWILEICSELLDPRDNPELLPAQRQTAGGELTPAPPAWKPLAGLRRIRDIGSGGVGSGDEVKWVHIASQRDRFAYFCEKVTIQVASRLIRTLKFSFNKFLFCDLDSGV